jgi:hypothetical protein
MNEGPAVRSFVGSVYVSGALSKVGLSRVSLDRGRRRRRSGGVEAGYDTVVPGGEEDGAVGSLRPVSARSWVAPFCRGTEDRTLMPPGGATAVPFVSHRRLCPRCHAPGRSSARGTYLCLDRSPWTGNSDLRTRRPAGRVTALSVPLGSRDGGLAPQFRRAVIGSEAFRPREGNRIEPFGDHRLPATGQSTLAGGSSSATRLWPRAWSRAMP